MPTNFNGSVKKYNINFNTNQTFFKNKMNVNFSLMYSYTDNSDFNTKNKITNAKITLAILEVLPIFLTPIYSTKI
jgi:hypothetical protein